jgi:hypothetical protein
MFFGAGSPFLTNAPTVYELCYEENAFISFVPAVCNTVRVTTRDVNLAVIDIGLFSITPNATYVPTTIGVGMINLASQVYFDGAVSMGDPDIYQYDIEVGQAFLFGSTWTFISFSEIRTYRPISCCNDRSLRLHWINRLGGADSYTFRSKKTISQKTKSETAQIPLSWGYVVPPTSSYDKGRFKIQQETVQEYEAESTFYTKEEGAWIAELLSSPEVYLEDEDSQGVTAFISVVIEDLAIKISENDQLLNVTIQFTESNNLSTQQN